MPEMFKITKDEVTPFIKKFTKATPKQIGKGLHQIALYGQTQLRSALTRKGIGSKELWSETVARKKSNKRSVIFVPGRGVAVDRMSPHYVALKRGRNINKWVRDNYPLTTGKHSNSARGKREPQRIYKGPKGGLKGAIWVRPHPWIDRPLEITEKNSIKIMNNELNKEMK